LRVEPPGPVPYSAARSRKKSLEAGLPRTLRGSLGIISFADLLSLLANTRKSGRLLVGEGARQSELLLHEGQVQRVRSEATARLLGGILLRQGTITAEAWADLAGSAEQDLLDEELLQRGVLNPITLAEALRELIVEEVTRLLPEETKPFVFEEGVRDAPRAIEVAVPMEFILLHAAQRRDERDRGQISPDGLLAETRPLLGKLVRIDRDEVVQDIQVRLGTTTLGSSADADVRIDDPDLAPLQLRICLTGRRYFLDDLEGRGRVHVNWEPVERRALEDGDEISIGRFRFLFHRVAALDLSGD
jgi:hypothetical protein